MSTNREKIKTGKAEEEGGGGTLYNKILKVGQNLMNHSMFDRVGNTHTTLIRKEKLER